MTRRRIRIGALPSGALNAITDVPGVRVGHATVIQEKPVVARTGVTAIYPTEKDFWEENVFAGFHRYNGHGEVSGVQWLQEIGVLTTPILLTGTFSLGLVRDTMLRETMRTGLKKRFGVPVVGETNDYFLNDAPKWPITADHVLEAMRGANSGPVSEGNVGAGTGVIAYLFKGGIGTSSKAVETDYGQFTVGALVQSNHGRREDLVVDGAPVGRDIGADRVPFPELKPGDPYIELPPFMRKGESEDGSIQIVIATDAPLLPIQCQRLAQRAIIGLGRAGGMGNNGSGDFAIAFSTANRFKAMPDAIIRGVDMFPNDKISPLFSATIEATETAIINSMLAADTMTGRNGNIVHALPHDLLLESLKRTGREWKD